MALAYVTGDSRCSRFSSDGCVPAAGFSRLSDYDLEQLMLETALHPPWFRLGTGAALQAKVRDQQTGEVTRLVGGYAQLGSILE